MEIKVLLIFFALLLKLAETLEVFDCETIPLVYHDHYGYGTDIICNGLQSTLAMKTKYVNKEILLKIISSKLDKVNADLFENVSEIRYLYLINSTVTFSTDTPFKYLQNLEHLIIENMLVFDTNKLNIFVGLPNLKELALENNNLTMIHNGTNLEGLETLTISNNMFSNLSDAHLCHFPNLKYFNARSNNLKIVSKDDFLCQSSFDNNFEINGYKLAITTKSEMIIGRQVLDLIEIDLGFNQIHAIDGFDSALKLKHLNLEANRLVELKEDLFMFVTQLVKLNLRGNLLKKIGKAVFGKLQDLKVLELNDNKLSEVFLTNLKSLECLNLAKNRLTSNGLVNMKLLPNLKYLFLNDNLIEEFPVNGQTFTNLLHLDLSNNQINFDKSYDKIKSNWGFKNLVKLCLRHNNLTKIPTMFFEFLENLQILDMSFNKITTLNLNHFQHIQKLQILNVSSNMLTSICYNSVKTLNNLKILDLGGNYLKTFNLLPIVPSLQFLNIKHNQFSCENLEIIIRELKANNVSFRIHEKMEYDQENIAGIYCKEPALNEKKTMALNGHIQGGSWFIFIAIVISLVALFVIFTAVYKFLLSRKRRNYNDHIELIEDVINV